MEEFQFHPIIARWFEGKFGTPTEPQRRGWPAIQSGAHTLIAAPTGSGKTLAAFLASLDALFREGLNGTLRDETRVLYVSPLKALSNDIHKNLEEPLAGVSAAFRADGGADIVVRSEVRTGDTPAAKRQAILKRPPHILVTTPESLYLLLTSVSGRKMLSTVRTLIVDEIHAVIGSRRGSHLALSMERLAALVPGPLQRIGLSATQKPIEEVAKFLVGTKHLNPSGMPFCRIIDAAHLREMDIGIELPGSPLEAVMSNEVWSEVYQRLVALIEAHRTTLVFVNTRRMAERVTHQLSARLGEDKVTSHHGSLSTKLRLDAENRLKRGELKVLVATSSLELGIDIGSVELVCQLGTTRSIANFLQRIGRAEHRRSGVPKGRWFPLTRDELVECLATLRCIRRGLLDAIHIPEKPLDILAQQVVAAAASEDWQEEKLFDLVRASYPYRNLAREEFGEIIRMLADGFSTKRGRRGALIHYDGVNRRIRGRRGARLLALTSGGAIPDNGDYRVVAEPDETFVGTVNEDFAVESMAGDVFQLGNTSWKIRQIVSGTVRVEDARGQPPGIPFWLGEGPARTAELSSAVSELRDDVQKVIEANGIIRPHPGPRQTWQASLPRGEGESSSALGEGEAALFPRGQEHSGSTERLKEWFVCEMGAPEAAARQLADYFSATHKMLGVIPSQKRLVMERFFDESGGMQLVIHTPFGARLNRAWGLALRKRFCRSFNFELQAAATDDAIVLSLGTQHSFPLEEVFRYLNSKSVRGILVQALLDAPMFPIRWRWNATRALALPRQRNGRKVPAPLQRMESENLLAAVFPDQLACLENIVGDREVPDHPLVRQTIEDCLSEAMDIEGLEALLRGVESRAVECLARDLPEPSPLAHEILNARPYAFLDNAPLEERRTQAVYTRRASDASGGNELGILDAAAIERVCAEAWPQARNADELHEALLLLGVMTEDELARCSPDAKALLEELVAANRAGRLMGETGWWVAAERVAMVREVYPQRIMEPVLEQPRVELKREAVVQASKPAVSPTSKSAGLPNCGRARQDGQLAGSEARDTESEQQKGCPQDGGGWKPPQPAGEDACPTVSTGDEPGALRELLRGRMEVIGPVTIPVLSQFLALSEKSVEAALLALEAEGFVLRGRFHPGVKELEWCDRRLLARIHRLTLNRLRAEIQPVSLEVFQRYLLAWQRADSEHQAEGPAGVQSVLELLDGTELAAAAWEPEVLALRVKDYTPQWLDQLCLAGRIGWGRLSPLHNQNARAPVPLRSTPIAVFDRDNLSTWLELSRQPANGNLAPDTELVLQTLARSGAMFFAELVRASKLLPSRVAEALGELAARGWATADSFEGLRALLIPAHKRAPFADLQRRRHHKAVTSVESAGRWALLRKPSLDEVEEAAEPGFSTQAVEVFARILLRRYGIVFRRLLEREALGVSWYELGRVYRRLEARGEIRGGHFVQGASGEQFALPEAIGLLRSIRKAEPTGECIVINAADPLNLQGILTPGPRVTSITANRILLRDGRPVAALIGGKTEMLNGHEPDPVAIERTLTVGKMSPQLRPYYG